MAFPFFKREKRENIIRQIQQEEKEKRKLEDQIDALTEQHSKMIDSLSKRRSKKKEYDKTIEQTEKAFQKILESSHTLLHVLKNEVHNLGRHDDHNDHDDSSLEKK